MFDVILDRDGTLTIDTGHTYRLEDCILVDRAKEALRLLQSVGARFSIATGQSGLAKGLYSEADMHAFNARLLEQCKEGGISIAAVEFCAHHPESSPCDCRKPNTGMLRRIEQKIGPIDWKQTWGIGDKPADAQMILTMGGRSVLLRPGPHNNIEKPYWDENDPALASLLKNPRNFVADSLLEAAQLISQRLAEFQ